MSGAHEAMEHAEHTEHAGHGGTLGKYIGITMALITVLIAFCTAVIGTVHNELMKAMIQQADANSFFSSASTKFRIVMDELEHLRSQAKSVQSPALADAGAKEQVATSSVDPVLLHRFLQVYLDYTKERKYTKEWSDSFDPLIDAQFDATEGYETAQFIAEVAIVFAALAIVLGSRAVWIFSIVVALLCVGQLGKTWINTAHQINVAHEAVEKKREAYDGLRKAHTGANQDEATVEFLDPDGKIRASLKGAEEKK